MLSILLLDEQEAILEALSYAIEREHDFTVCFAANDVKKALSAARSLSPDIIVTEIVLPGWYGIDAISRFPCELEHTGVVVYSMCDEQIYARRALAAGARGYVMKTEPSSTLIDAVRVVARGEIYLSPLASRHLLGDVTGAFEDEGHFTDSLTSQEMTAFHLIGKGHDLDYIASYLNVSRRTAESYRNRILDKLGLENQAQLFRAAISTLDASAARFGSDITQKC